MGYQVILWQDRTLVDRWQNAAERLMDQLDDPGSAGYRKVLALGVPATAMSLPALKDYQSGLKAIATGLLANPAINRAAVEGGLGKVSAGISDVTAIGVTELPEEGPEQDKWLAGFGKSYEGVQEIQAASLAAAATYAKLADCRKVLGQIKIYADSNELLLLKQDDVPQAIAARRISAQDVIVADLVAAPEYIASGGSGAGGILMEYMAREAKNLGGGVSLLALGAWVESVYQKWGFTGEANKGMVLRQPALDSFLSTHTKFAQT